MSKKPLTLDERYPFLETKGKYITITCNRDYFDHVIKMLLEHYDCKKYVNTIFLLGSYTEISISKLKHLYKGKKIILYQLEQLFNLIDRPSPTHISIFTQVDYLLKFKQEENFQIWDMDEANVVFLDGCGVKVDRLKPLKYTSCLKQLESKESPEIDLLFYGSLNERRVNIIREITKPFYWNKWSVVTMQGINLDKIDSYIKNSKIILNLHHTEPLNRQEQPRIFYPVINDKCVLSEPSTINYFGDSIVEAPLEVIGGWIKILLNEGKWKEVASKASERYRNLSNVRQN